MPRNHFLVMVATRFAGLFGRLCIFYDLDHVSRCCFLVDLGYVPYHSVDFMYYGCMESDCRTEIIRRRTRGRGSDERDPQWYGL